QMPRMHRYYNDTCAPYYDILLVAESARQATEAISHELLGISLDTQFVITEMWIALVDPGALRVRDVPTEMRAELRITRQRRRADGSLRAIDGDVFCWIADSHVATFSGKLVFVSPETYGHMRDGTAVSTGLPPPGGPRADPASVGRRDPGNVVI